MNTSIELKTATVDLDVLIDAAWQSEHEHFGAYLTDLLDCGGTVVQFEASELRRAEFQIEFICAVEFDA